ncbi:MAG: hypothetical protein EP330_03270 [Deltaproteobacteria bacterium]|nr:MAG: hypothetical protein EP330_03270 [Deltaproteobacteria bacterium]
MGLRDAGKREQAHSALFGAASALKRSDLPLESVNTVDRLAQGGVIFDLAVVHEVVRGLAETDPERVAVALELAQLEARAPDFGGAADAFASAIEQTAQGGADDLSERTQRGGFFGHGSSDGGTWISDFAADSHRAVALR